MEEVKSSDAGEDNVPTVHSLRDNDPSVLNGNDDHDLWCDDEDVCNESNGELNVASDLDREWQRRHNQFHNIGYRDGLTAGKEASAQEGFNSGFKQSVFFGYKWGYVRGITSALVHLPTGLKEKLVELEETREKLQNLHESVHAVSTKEALSEFHADVVVNRSKEEGVLVANMTPEIPSSNLLGRYIEEFDSLNLGPSALGTHSFIKSHAVG